MTPAELSKCGLIMNTSYVLQVALQDLKPNETHLEFYKRMFIYITRLILKTTWPACWSHCYAGGLYQTASWSSAPHRPGADQDCLGDPLLWTLCVSGERVWKEQLGTLSILPSHLSETHVPNIRFDWRCLQ